MISPEVRISETLKIEKQKLRGSIREVRTWENPAVNLFGLNAVRECRGQLVIDARSDSLEGTLTWE